MKRNQYRLAGTFLACALAGGGTARAAPLFPITVHTGDDPVYGGANFVIEFNAVGSITTFIPHDATATYDGSDDALIGVINNSSDTNLSFGLSEPSQGIYGFDGDGIDTFNGDPTSFTIDPANPDTTTYGGPIAYFTEISPIFLDSGTVNFTGGIAPGGSTFFSLEEAIDFGYLPLVSAPVIAPTGVPEPTSLAILASGIFGYFALRHCQDRPSPPLA